MIYTRWTGPQFRMAQDEIGWTNVRLARALGVSEEAVCRWRNGRRRVPGPVMLAMQALVDGWRPQ